MNDLFNEFISEARQQIEAAEASLLAMAQAPASADVQACFRALHTLKGNSGFFDLPRLHALAHTAEQLLDAIRGERVVCDQERIDALLAAVSQLGELIDGLAADGAEPAVAGEALVERLGRLSGSMQAPASAPTSGSGNPVAAVPTTPLPLAPRVGGSGRPVQTCLVEFRGLAVGDIAGAVRLGGELRRLAQADSWSAVALEAVDAISDEVDGLVLAGPAAIASGFARLAARLGDLATILPAAALTLDPAVLAEFVDESADLLADAERPVLVGDGLDAAGVTTVLGALGTLKDLAGYLELPRLAALIQAVEDRLLPLHGGGRPATAGDGRLVLQAVEALRAVVYDIVLRHGDHGPLAVTAVVLASELGVTLDAVSPTAAPAAAAAVTALAAPPSAAVNVGVPGRSAGDGTARVSTSRLDELMNLMGELLIAHSMVAQGGDGVAGAAIVRQGRIIRELQTIALGLRMVPLRGTCQKMARAVHDTARKLGKQVAFRLVGEDTEIDRSLAETISDPLLHMVRNAVDHGIESGDARTTAGKPVTGTVRLTARQTADYVEIILADDGRGLDPVRLRAKAVEKGLIAAAQPLSDAEAFELIFLPGFTTAVAVTEVSGRGVGMDVVRRNLAQVSGRIDIRSVLGQGTTFTIRLPLTTAIIDAMLVGVAGERFLVPIGAVIELVAPRPGQVQAMLGSGRVIERRGRLLPVIALAELFAVAPSPAAVSSRVLLVVAAGDQLIALEVDTVIGQQQVVVKPLDRRLGHASGLSGSAILGDGCVGLIIDPARLLSAGKAAWAPPTPVRRPAPAPTSPSSSVTRSMASRSCASARSSARCRSPACPGRRPRCSG